MEVLEAHNYSTGLLDQLYALQQNNVHCDTRITAEGGGVSAHKVVLMAASSYLNSCLSTKVQSEVGSRGSIHIQNTPFRLIERVISFIYTGKLTIYKEDFDMTFKLCKDLEITSAISLCENYSAVLHKRKASEISFDKGLENETFVEHINSSKSENTDENINSASQVTVEENLNTTCIRTSLGKDNSENSHVVKTRGKSRKSAKKPSKDRTYPKKTSVKTGSKSKQKQLVKVKKVRSKKKVKSVKIANAESESVLKSMCEKSTAIAIVIENAEGEMEEDRKFDESEVEGFAEEGEDNSDTDEISETSSSVFTKKSVISKRTAGVRKGLTNVKRKTQTETGNENKTKIKVRRFKQFPCSYCSKILTSHKRLAFHEFSRHGAPFDESRYTMYPCTKEGCTYVSGSKSNLRTHLKSRHADDRPHVCEFCGKAFKLPSVLAIHLNIHTGSKDWKCETCGEHFNQQSGLSVHIKRHHTGESSWGELCHLCSEKFLQKSDLAWHLFRVHEQPLPEKYKAYICDICNYLTKSSQDLQRHKNAHNGIKQFSCSVCKKSCSTKSQLKRHERFHGEKSFKCMYDSCTYACVDSIGLNKHITLMHTHKNFKPYICPVCSYKTGVKGNLDKHIRQVHFLDVVTKHTVQLKMKYANFESGDIITKDGRLVASAKERKELHQRCLEENRMAINSQEEMDCSVKSIIQNNEDKIMYHVNNQQRVHKPVQPFKPMSLGLRQEPPTNSVINLSSVNTSYGIVDSSHAQSHIPDTMASTVQPSNVVYVQGTY